MGEQPEARLQKLSTVEFTNSVRDLLGNDVPVSALEPDHQIDGFQAVAAAVSAISPAGVARYEAALDAATGHAFADATRAARVLSCVPATATDTACATKALTALGRRAFRRPLVDDEVTRFLGVAQSVAAEPGSSMLVGMRHAVWAILQSPSFLYRVELGTPSAPDGGRSKYSNFEMSSRLASLLWATVPDDTLLDAAVTGELSTAEGLRKHTERMLASPRAQLALTTFFDDIYEMSHLTDAIKDAKMFPAWTPTLRDAMHEELTRRLNEVVLASPGDFLSLYDQPSTFVNNELARFYGLPTVAMDRFRRFDLPADGMRRGLLGSGAILASNALPQRTSPTARGKFVMETLLCRTVPPAPDNVNTDLPMDATKPVSLRKQLEEHRTNPTCAACHALMDPIGLGLENFDSTGALRTNDGNETIDASGQLDGVPFKNAAELATALRNHPNAGPCFVRKLYTHALARVPITVDEPVVSALATKFRSNGNRADRLIADMVTSDAFRFVQIGQR